MTTPLPASLSAPAPTPVTSLVDVLHLNSEITNWATFSHRFRHAMVLAGHWGYFKGTTTAPVPQDPSNPTNAETLEAQ